MINYSIWCFVLSFSSSNVLGNKYHNQKWRALYFTRIKLEVRVLVCVRVIARIKLKCWALWKTERLNALFPSFWAFCLCCDIYVYIYRERVYREKTKESFSENISATAYKNYKGMIHIWRLWKFPNFQDPPLPSSIYAGFTWTTYCVRYPHTVPFLRNEMLFSLIKTPRTHAV